MPEMRVPLKWLQEYVDIALPIPELAERMTLAQLEVNTIEQLGANWERDKIFVGQIVEVRAHPNADRLTIAVVDYGSDAPQAVVTGAPNIRVGDAGQKVAFATRGARLIDGHSDGTKWITLKPSNIRGVRSEGMVCSEKELGISDDHTGIMILPDDAPVGMPLQDYLGDTVLVIEIIPNIARCLSMIGVAREVAALTGQKLRLAQPEWRTEGPPITGQIEVEIADPDICSRYSASLICNVQIGPSPFWMQRRLIAAGMRPINNIVDITNYVMLEWGQPLHAFDYDKLRGRSGKTPPMESPVIIVRRARAGERMTTLDGVDRLLDEEMLLITDGGGPVAIAGVMGGLETEVTEETRNILLESANFDYINNRRTTQLLNLPSEAATRFGRGIDPELTITGLKRASELMRVLAGGTIAEGIVDNYPVKPKVKIITFPPGEVERIAGIKLSARQITDILESLEFRCELPKREGDPIQVTVPSHRLDVSLKADLVEEVARVYGAENIPFTLMADPLPPQRNNPLLSATEKARDVLVSCGLSEVITYSLIALEDQDKLLAAYGDLKPHDAVAEPEVAYPTPCIMAAGDCIQLSNPLTPEHRLMRTTLLPSMLMILRDNLRYQQRLALFEIASVYWPRKGENLPDEPRHLCIGLTGPREVRWWGGDGAEPADPSRLMDFFDLKGIVEVLLERLQARGVTFEGSDSLIFQPGRAATIRVQGIPVACMGEVHPLVREAFELPPQRICLLELDLEQLLAHVEDRAYHKPISRFPPVVQDLALVVDEAIPAQQVQELILEAGRDVVSDIHLFDVYRGEPIPIGKKSLAYAISYQDMSRTLTDKDVQRIRDRIQAHLERRIGAQVRVQGSEQVGSR